MFATCEIGVHHVAMHTYTFTCTNPQKEHSVCYAIVCLTLFPHPLGSVRFDRHRSFSRTEPQYTVCGTVMFIGGRSMYSEIKVLKNVLKNRIKPQFSAPRPPISKYLSAQEVRIIWHAYMTICSNIIQPSMYMYSVLCKW